jgi:hypothetical protein
MMADHSEPVYTYFYVLTGESDNDNTSEVCVTKEACLDTICQGGEGIEGDTAKVYRTAQVRLSYEINESRRWYERIEHKL